jgi:hypothetical protein
MHRFVDANQALGFLVSQTSHIEAQVVEVKYPDIQYQNLIPVDTSANEWAKSVTYYSLNKVGAAGWFHHYAKDIHVADAERSKHEVGIEMADIGYRWTLEELGLAMMVPGANLPADRAGAARRAYEEFVDKIAIRGDSDKNFTGIINRTDVTKTWAANGAGGSPDWDAKTGDEILADVNDALTGVYTGSLTVELADTVLLPVAEMSLIATKRLDSNGSTLTVLQFLQQNNVYSHVSGKPLTIRAVRGLEDAGENGSGRMVVYRRDPQVLKLHLPMTHRFLPVWQTGPLVFDVPGIFRIAGLEIRRPGAVRYVDGIQTTAYE